jgi:hypothetical protein
LHELRNLIRNGTNWQEEGWEPPESVFDIKLRDHGSRSETVVNLGLVKKTLSYEARDVTVNLDFDEKGYLISVEFV